MHQLKLLPLTWPCIPFRTPRRQRNAMCGWLRQRRRSRRSATQAQSRRGTRRMQHSRQCRQRQGFGAAKRWSRHHGSCACGCWRAWRRSAWRRQTAAAAVLCLCDIGVKSVWVSHQSRSRECWECRETVEGECRIDSAAAQCSTMGSRSHRDGACRRQPARHLHAAAAAAAAALDGEGGQGRHDNRAATSIHVVEVVINVSPVKEPGAGGERGGWCGCGSGNAREAAGQGSSMLSKYKINY